MRPLIIMRPEPGASASASAAGQLGLKAVVVPLFAVQPVKWRAPDPREFDGLLLTSANAVRHGGSEVDRVRDLPAHCVGEGTAAAARDAGFSIASVGAGGLDALLAKLPADMRLLHLSGRDRREPQAPNQSIRAIPVYEAVRLPAPKSCKAFEGAVVAVHSPRAASRLAELADEEGLRRETIGIVAISDEAAAAAGARWLTVKAAANPNDSALLALAASLCNNL
ncbi:MAG: uroporphyrinogen-III synthase [Sphingomicrobium sp.]